MKTIAKQNWPKAPSGRSMPCLLALFSLCLSLAAGAATRTNLVFILADDLGWMDTSLYGSRFLETPNIDKLAARGRMFVRAYAANPLCSPTRASILTGLDPARIGITAPVCHQPEVRLRAELLKQAPPRAAVLQARSATRLDTNYITLAESLRDAGYATGHFGKWHLGSEPYSALQQGFEVDVPHYPGPGPAGSFVAPWKFPARLKFQGREREHLEERMTQEAIAWLRKNQDRPFFLNYWCFSVHAPFDAKTGYIEAARDKVDPGLPQRSPTYHAMVHSLDDAVGRLMEELENLGVADSTLVVFFSDNGGNMYNRIDGGIPPTSNAPLRGGKANLYEGGVRVPMVVAWPGKVPPGSRSDALFTSTDFYPTLLELLGLHAAPGQRFDGVSQAGAWLGSERPRSTAFTHVPHYTPATGHRPATALWEKDWKLIRWHGDNPDQSDRLELFNLRTDIGESHSLAAAHPERVARMNRMIGDYLGEIGAVVPVRNARYQPPEDPSPSDPSDLAEETRVYRHIDGSDLELWMVKPKGWKPTDQRPAMVFYHGGAWTGGTHAQFHPFARHLAQHGMVAFSVQYRLLNRQDNEPPAICVEDAKCALRWIRSLSNELGVDPGRIGAGGGSAGGHLAATVGMIEGLEASDQDLRVPSRADALVLFNPVFDNGPGGWGHNRVGDRSGAFSPFHNISADDPPTLVMSGSEDTLIPANRIREFQERMKSAGVRCEVEIHEEAGHGFFNKGRSNDHFFNLTRDRMTAFLASLGWIEP